MRNALCALTLAGLAGCVGVSEPEPAPSRHSLSSVVGTTVAVQSSSGSPTEAFGTSFAARGIALAVGAPDATGGRVSVFLDAPGDGFAESTVIRAPNDLPFGVAVSVGNEAIAATASDGATSEVWIATADKDTGALNAPVQIVPTSAVGPRFGAALDVHKNYMVIAEPSDDGITPGRAFVFGRVEDTWVQEAVLSDGGSPRFGSTVAIWDDCAVISSGTETQSGPVYAYVRSEEGLWTLDGTVYPEDVLPDDGFGASITANDKDIFVGAPGRDDFAVDSGAIYFYVHRSDGWGLNYVFGLPTPDGSERLGVSLAMDGHFILAGGPGSDLGNQNSGTAYLFWWFQDEGKLGVVDILYGLPTAPDRQIGEHVALANGLAVFGNRPALEVWQARYIRPPIGRSDQIVVPAIDPYDANWSVLDNDVEPDGEPMTARIAEATANGVLDLRADGTFSYTPHPTFIGTDTFTYYANDGTFDSRLTEVDIVVEPEPAQLCGEVLCAHADVCYADVCFPSCDSNAQCGSGRSCFVGRCASSACSSVVCPAGQVCYGGSCFAACAADGCPSGDCFEGRCAPDPCSQVQCPIDYVCHGGGCFPSCEEDSQCGDSACWDGRCTSDPCAGVQCLADEVCVGGSCFLGCTDDAQCGSKRCIQGRCAANACEGISCRIGQVCHEGGCVRACTSSDECSAGNTCQSGKCLPPPPADDPKGCATVSADASVWLLLIFAAVARRR